MHPLASASMALARRRDNMACAFQEILAVSERLRSGRDAVADAALFRRQVFDTLKAAEQHARVCGYAADDIRQSVFAVVAFLDESILNLGDPVFADWPRRPLQEELFGHHVAGEVFFRNLQELLGRSDSQELADVLEVYALCLVLGFAGRYGIGSRGDLRAITEATANKIRRIRGSGAALSPESALPPEAPRLAAPDPWVRRLILSSAALFAVAVILFVIYKLLLGSNISSLAELAGPARQ